MRSLYTNLTLLAALALLVGGVFYVAPPAAAQVGPSPNQSITISSSPRFAEPYQMVEITAGSRLVNLNDKQIAWSQDGAVVDSGIGVDTVTITVGAAGEATTISFQTVAAGSVIERELTIIPSDIDLIWEATESYTPPFYAGKALHPGWGPVRVSVLPFIYKQGGGRYSREELVYTWSYNGLVYGDDSGRGQSSFVIQAVPRRGNTVKVEIKTPADDLIARESITLPISGPQVLLYPDDPLRGTRLERAITDTYILEGARELSLVAEPYFFLTERAVGPGFEYDWEMNGETLQPTEAANQVTLRVRAGASGQSRVSLGVEDNSRIFPNARSSAVIEF